MRAPGGSFIWPYTRAHFEPLVEPLFFFGSDVDVRLDHLVIEVVALACALADTGEHRVAAVHLGDVVDQLHDENRLADAGAAEEADLAALGVRREQIHHLNARHEDLSFRRLFRRSSGAGWWMARLALVLTGPASSTGSPMTLMMRPSVSSPTGTMIGEPVSTTSWPRTRPSGAVHGDRAHGILAEMLRYLENQAVAMVLGFQRIQNRRQMSVELYVDDRAHYLANLANLALAIFLSSQ